LSWMWKSYQDLPLDSQLVLLPEQLRRMVLHQ
jgi:hypothetical protein